MAKDDKRFIFFKDMEDKETKPNEITFTGVLTARSYSGLVEEGKALFERTEKYYNIRPTVEHYGRVVDVLGRAGRLNEAEELIAGMPMKPNAVVWGALLAARRIHGDHNRGMHVGNILIRLDPNHGGRYVNLANILAANGDRNRAAMVRKMTRRRKVLKLPGSSLMNVDRTVHEFFAGDGLHKHIEKIYLERNKIPGRPKKEGYRSETEEVSPNLEEEEKETAVHFHSEKLAIGFALITTEPGSTIHIIKNLRACEDCRNISKVLRS